MCGHGWSSFSSREWEQFVQQMENDIITGLILNVLIWFLDSSLQTMSKILEMLLINNLCLNPRAFDLTCVTSMFILRCYPIAVANILKPPTGSGGWVGGRAFGPVCQLWATVSSLLCWQIPIFTLSACVYGTECSWLWWKESII